MRSFYLGFILIFAGHFVFGQDLDSALNESPFVKGRWISGLSGSISTTTTALDTTSNRTFTNQYGINLRSAKFIADKWALGVLIGFSRRNTDALIEESSDLFQVGPFVRFYTSTNPRGSLFFQTAVTYTKFDARTIIDQPTINFESTVKGDGASVVFGIGYAYAMSRSISFDLGINYDFGFLDAEVEDIVANTIDDQNINRFSTTFNFGFVILIDEFFF